MPSARAESVVAVDWRRRRHELQALQLLDAFLQRLDFLKPHFLRPDKRLSWRPVPVFAVSRIRVAVLDSPLEHIAAYSVAYVAFDHIDAIA